MAKFAVPTTMLLGPCLKSNNKGCVKTTFLKACVLPQICFHWGHPLKLAVELDAKSWSGFGHDHPGYKVGVPLKALSPGYNLAHSDLSCLFYVPNQSQRTMCEWCPFLVPLVIHLTVLGIDIRAKFLSNWTQSTLIKPKQKTFFTD